MLELIFQGFIEWIYSLILECWNWLSTSLLDIMSLDFTYIKTHAPVIPDIMRVLLAVGWALLLGNLVFQALRSMASGLGFEGEDPKLLFARTFVFSFLLLGSSQLCEIGLNMTSKIIDLLQLPSVIDVHLVDASLFGNLTAGWLVVIVCDIIIMWKVLKLLLKIAEQYVVLSTLTIAAPLAFAMGGSKSTAPIFTGWCRMYGSMCLLMVSDTMFFKLMLSVMSTIPSGLDVFPWMVLLTSLVKVAKRMDDTITRIGLNPAQTGERGGGRSIPGMLAATVMRGAVSQVTKTLGGAVGGAAGNTIGTLGRGVAGAGRSAAGTVASGLGGASAAAGLGGLGSILRSGGGRNTSQQNTSQQTYNQQGNMQQSATQQYQQSTTNAQQTAPSSGASVPSGGSNPTSPQGGSTSRYSRNSSVPPGTTRSPSYVSPSYVGRAGGSSSGTAGTGTGSRATETADGTRSEGSRGGGFAGGQGFGSGRGGDFGSDHSGSFGGGSRGSGFGSGRGGSFGGGSRGEGFGSGRGGSFGGGSRGSGSGGERGGSFGGGSRGSGSGAERGGVFGGGTGASPTGTAGTGGAVPGNGAAAAHTLANTPGTQTPAAPNRTDISRPGTAGTGSPATMIHGQQAQPAASPGTTPARSTKVTGQEKARRPAVSSGGAAAPSPSAKPAKGQHTKSTESRSTRRTTTETKRTTTTETTLRSSGQSGTAGTAAPTPVRQPAKTPPGRVVPPVTGAQPPKPARSSPAQQETRQSSGTGTLLVNSGAPNARPGTAGTAPEIHRDPQERKTAKEPEKTDVKKLGTPGVKRQPTPPAATGKKSGPKPPDRSRGGGYV